MLLGSLKIRQKLCQGRRFLGYRLRGEGEAHVGMGFGMRKSEVIFKHDKTAERFLLLRHGTICSVMEQPVA